MYAIVVNISRAFRVGNARPRSSTDDGCRRIEGLDKFRPQPLPFPHGLTFKLGFAGGPLVAGLILGRLEKTGRIIWEMPYNANLVLRQVGLVFFMAAIGTKAGSGLTYANQQCDCELPNVWYATVYPASMVAKIIPAQLIVSTILMF